MLIKWLKTRLYEIYNDHLYNNAIWLILNSIMLTGLGFFFWTINARLFTSEQVGFGTAIITSMQLIVGISSLGFNIALVRYLPQSKNKERMIRSCFTISGTMALVISIIFILGLDMFSPKLGFIRENLLYGILFSVFVVFNIIFILIEAVLIVHRKSKLVFLKNLVFSILKLAFPFLLVSMGAFGIFSSWGFSAIAALIVILILIRMRPGFVVDTKIMRRMFKFSSGNYIAGFLRAAPNLIIPLMMVNLVEPEMAAYFYIALMIASLLYVIPNAISAPLIVESSLTQNKLPLIIKRVLRFAFVLLLPGVVVLLVSGKYLLLLFGKAYSDNGLMLLQILVLSSIPASINIIYEAVKNIQHKIKTVVMLNVVRASGILILSYLLIDYGLIGIGIGWLLGTLSVTAYIGYKFIRDKSLE